MKGLLIVLLATLVLAGYVSAQNVAYVSATSTCTSNCGTLERPFRTIPEAVNAVQTSGTILLLRGTYNFGGLSLNNSNIAIRGVCPEGPSGGLGGFPGFEIPPTCGIADAPVLNCQNNNFGFRLSTGTYLLESLRIQNCVCTNCDGGAIYLNDSVATFSKLIIAQNSAGGNGGGIAYVNSVASTRDCLIISNRARGSGGGVSIISSAVQFTNSAIRNNFARGRGGGVYVRDGRIVQFINTRVTDNMAANRGSNLYCLLSSITAPNLNVFGGALGADGAQCLIAAPSRKRQAFVPLEGETLFEFTTVDDLADMLEEEVSEGTFMNETAAATEEEIEMLAEETVIEPIAPEIEALTPEEIIGLFDLPEEDIVVESTDGETPETNATETASTKRDILIQRED